MAVEFELKYSCTRQALELLRADLPGDAQHFAMQTVYYDTPAGDLSALRYTLRCRRENERSVCTLKIPAADGARGEFEVDCDCITDAIPMLCKLSGVDLAALCAGGLIRVCGAAFQREARTFQWKDARIEAALDMGVLTGGDRELPFCEAELELKAGSRQDMETYGAFLTAAYGLKPESRSKFSRALALAKGE